MATEILTHKEVAAYLRISPVTLHRLLKRREIPAFRLGADWRFRKDLLDKWMTERALKC